MLEKSCKFDTDLCYLFIDFNQAYDTVFRDKLCNILEKLSALLKLIILMKTHQHASQGARNDFRAVPNQSEKYRRVKGVQC